MTAAVSHGLSSGDRKIGLMTPAARGGDRRRAHPVLPLQHALCRQVEPGDADRRAQRAGRQVQPRRACTSTRRSAAPSSRTPRTGTWPARRCSAPSSRRRRPASPCMQACGTSLQAASMHRRPRSPPARSSAASPWAPTPPRTRRSSFKQKFAHRLVEAQNATSMGQRLAAFKGFSPGELAPQPPSVSEPRTGLSMGQHAELMAQEWKITPSRAGPAGLREPQEGGGGLPLGLHGRPDRAVRRRVPRQQPARGHQPREDRARSRRRSTSPSAAR